MRVVGGGDAENVDLLALQHLREVRVGRERSPGVGALRGEIGRQIAHRHQVSSGVRVIGGGMGVRRGSAGAREGSALGAGSDPSQADDRGSVGLAHFVLGSPPTLRRRSVSVRVPTCAKCRR